jgi:hypothetical protein
MNFIGWRDAADLQGKRRSASAGASHVSAAIETAASPIRIVPSVRHSVHIATRTRVGETTKIIRGRAFNLVIRFVFRQQNVGKDYSVMIDSL